MSIQASAWWVCLASAAECGTWWALGVALSPPAWWVINRLRAGVRDQWGRDLVQLGSALFFLFLVPFVALVFHR